MELQNATHRGQHHGGRIQVYCCEFLYYSSTNLKRATATLIERSIRLVRSDPNNLLNQSKYISVTLFNAFFKNKSLTARRWKEIQEQKRSSRSLARFRRRQIR